MCLLRSEGSLLGNPSCDRDQHPSSLSCPQLALKSLKTQVSDPWPERRTNGIRCILDQSRHASGSLDLRARVMELIVQHSHPISSHLITGTGRQWNSSQRRSTDAILVSMKENVTFKQVATTKLQKTFPLFAGHVHISQEANGPELAWTSALLSVWLRHSSGAVSRLRGCRRPGHGASAAQGPTCWTFGRQVSFRQDETCFGSHRL